MKPLVIPIFISHQGCPHHCIFCDQYTISGQPGTAGPSVTPEFIRNTIDRWLNRPRKDKRKRVQVAFYGGSFTGLTETRQKELLQGVQSYIRSGQVDSIRISTRPDYVNEAIIALLKKYSVNIVELGIQSFSQKVLEASSRGHSVQQSETALKLLKTADFKVGAQLMCGLPADNSSSLLATVRKTVELEPDFVRIYPALVIKGSGLEKMFRTGKYKPLSLGKAVVLSSRMKAIFDEHNIKVVRMGLQPSAELSERVAAGPYHPAFGELVMARNLFKMTRRILRENENGQGKKLRIAAADESVFRGQGNASIRRLTTLGLLENVHLIFDQQQPRNSVQVC